MQSQVTIHKELFILMVFILVGCTSIKTSPPSPLVNIPDYTAAAQTIAAQLTEISGQGEFQPPTILSTSTPTSSVEATATETLPNTSTPPPSRTALPENPLTVTRTSTSTPVGIASQIPTHSTADPIANLGDPDLSDTFVDGSNWFVYFDEHVNTDVQDNQLRMTALNADKYEAMMLSTQPIIDDFYMQVTASTGECSGLDRYGLIFRAPGFSPIQGYLYGFTCDGMYSLRVFDGVDFTAVVQWTHTELINTGPDKTNLLGISASGQDLKLFVNGKPLLSIQDDRFSSGYFGLFVGAYATPGFRASFSDFAYWLQP